MNSSPIYRQINILANRQRRHFDRLTAIWWGSSTPAISPSTHSGGWRGSARACRIPIIDRPAIQNLKVREEKS